MPPTSLLLNVYMYQWLHLAVVRHEKSQVKKCANYHVHYFLHVTAWSDSKAGMHGKSFVLLFHWCQIKLQLNMHWSPSNLAEQSKKRETGKTLEYRKWTYSRLHSPKFCIMSSFKGECISQCWIHARSTVFQGFLSEAQIPVSCVKENPKKQTRQVQWGQSFTYCSETEQEPALSQEDLGLDRWFKTNTTRKETNERTFGLHCRHLFDCIGQSQG